MTQVAQPPVACPGCGTRYRWRDEFAGKELSCKCGRTFRVQARSSGAAPAPAAAATQAKAATNGALPNPAAYGFTGSSKSAVERALEAREDEVQPSRARDLYLPLVLLPVGAVLSAVIWSRVMGTVGEGLTVYAVVVGLQLFVFLPLMFASVVTVAKWFELALGTLGGVLLKVAALTLGAAAICDPLFTAVLMWSDFDWQCVVAGYGFYLVIVGLPTLYLFEMGIPEAALTALLVFLPRIAAAFTAAMAFSEHFK